MKKSLYSIILSIILIVSTITVYASETENTEEIELRTTNVEQMTNDEINQFCKDITSAIKDKSSKEIEEYNECFDSDTLSKFNSFILSNNIQGEVSSIVTDWVYPQYSQTEDSLMLMNIKVQLDSYNELYLFEFHINSEGKIYGYNIWAY